MPTLLLPPPIPQSSPTTRATNQSTAKYPWAMKGLVGAWAASVDPTSRDLGRNNHGSLLGGTSVVTAYGGKAWEFVDEADSVSFGDSDIFSFTDGSDLPFTMSVWLNRAAIAVGAGVIDKYTASNWEYTLGFSSNNSLYAWVYDNSTYAFRGRFVANSDTWIPANTWHHIAWTYDAGGLTSSTKIYIDGVERDDNDFSGGTYVGMENLGANLALSGSTVGFTNTLDGLADLFLVHNRVLSRSEIVCIGNLTRNDRREIFRRKSRVAGSSAVSAATGNPWYYFAQQGGV